MGDSIRKESPLRRRNFISYSHSSSSSCLYYSSSTLFFRPHFTLLLCSHTMLLLTTKLGVGMHPRGSLTFTQTYAYMKLGGGHMPKGLPHFSISRRPGWKLHYNLFGINSQKPPADRTHLFSTISSVLNLEFVKDDHPPHPRTLPLWEKGAFIYQCSMTSPHLTSMGNKCILLSPSRFLGFIFKTCLSWRISTAFSILARSRSFSVAYPPHRK